MGGLEPPTHLVRFSAPMTPFRPPTRTWWVAGSSPAMTK